MRIDGRGFITINESASIGGSLIGQPLIPKYGGTGYSSYTKGDILVGAGSTFIRLSVGTNNYVLTADSTTASGLKWTPSSGGGFGLSTLNGIGSTDQFLVAGFAGNTFAISSVGDTHTFNIPVAGLGKTGLISPDAQTFEGIKTFNSNVIVAANSASGSTGSGALVVYGGVGISGNLNVGSSASIVGNVDIYGVINTGVWSGSAITSKYGGTGFTVFNKGDILVGTGSSNLSKVGVGSSRYVLSAGDMYSSGLGWTHITAVGVGTNPPSEKYDADLWWNSEDGSLNLYYNDGDTQQWVEVLAGNGPNINTNLTYGAFYSTTTQQVTGANTANPIKLDSTFESANCNLNGVGSTSWVRINNSGTYNVQFSAQINLANGNQPQKGDLWLRVNGTDDPWSNSQMSIQGKDYETILSLNFVRTFQANDYFELVMSSSDSDWSIQALSSLTLPTRPNVPGMIVTVTPVATSIGVNSQVDWSQDVNITSTTISQSSTTGALNVLGGVGIGGSLYVANASKIENTFTSTSASTGALVVAGGLGVGTTAHIGGDLHITATTNSTSTSSGALVVSGGAGIAGTLNTRTLGINSGFELLYGSLTTAAATANQVGFAVSTSTYRTLKFLVSVDSGSDYQSDEILMMHDGTSVYMTEYAQILSGSGVTITTYEGDINSGNIRLLVSPLNSVTNYHISCTGLRV